MSQKNSDTKPRMSYAGAAKQGTINTSGSSSASTSALTEEYPSLVPDKSQKTATLPNPVPNRTSTRRWETTAPQAKTEKNHNVPSDSNSKNGAHSSEPLTPAVRTSEKDEVSKPVRNHTESACTHLALNVQESLKEDPKTAQQMSWADLLKKSSNSVSQKAVDLPPSTTDNGKVSIESPREEAKPSVSAEAEKPEEPSGVDAEQAEQAPPEENIQVVNVEDPVKYDGMQQMQQYQIINPQYGFMVPIPQYMQQAPYYVPTHPGFMPPNLMQVSYNNQPLDYYAPNGMVAEQLVDGSIVYRYPDNPDMYYNQGPMNQGPIPYQPRPPRAPAARDDNWNNAVEVMEMENRIREKIGLLLAGRYRVVQKINMGSCGSIYTARDEHDPTNKLYAVKFENYKETESHLLYEFQVYKECSSYVNEEGQIAGTPHEGFAHVLWMGIEYGYRILIMELLGPSLENLFGYSFSYFCPETVYQLGMQMIDRIEHLHNCGFVHRDLKPDNFVMGLGDKENTVFLLDFGLTRVFQENKTNRAGYRRGRGLVGTAKYASLNSHNGYELSPRDDMESIGYILLEFIAGDVPWKVMKDKSRRPKQTYYNKMRQIKQDLDWEKVCPDLVPWIQHVKALNFNDKPNYNEFRRILRAYFEKSAPNSKTPLKEHLERIHLTESSDRFPRPQQGSPRQQKASNSNNKNLVPIKQEEPKTPERALTLEQRLAKNRFEWILRRESSANETYTYQCLFAWTLPFGTEPARPPDRSPSMRFGYGFGEGGYY